MLGSNFPTFFFSPGHSLGHWTACQSVATSDWVYIFIHLLSSLTTVLRYTEGHSSPEQRKATLYLDGNGASCLLLPKVPKCLILVTFGALSKAAHSGGSDCEAAFLSTVLFIPHP